MNAFSTAERAATLAHYTQQAALAAPIDARTKRDREALVSISGAFECKARFNVQQGSVYLTALCFDTVEWIDPVEWMLASKIRLIEADIEESIREAGQ